MMWYNILFIGDSMEYKGVEIELQEVENYDWKGATFTSKDGGLVFVATSKAGVSAANSPETALKGAYKLIDKMLDNG